MKPAQFKRRNDAPSNSTGDGWSSLQQMILNEPSDNCKSNATENHSSASLKR